MTNFDSFSEDLVPRITPQPAFIPAMVMFLLIISLCLSMIVFFFFFCFVEYFETDRTRSINNIR